MVLVIGGLNMTAKRMSAMVPQLPEYVIYAAREADMVYLDILGQEFQIRLPSYLYQHGFGGKMLILLFGGLVEQMLDIQFLYDCLYQHNKAQFLFW